MIFKVLFNVLLICGSVTIASANTTVEQTQNLQKSIVLKDLDFKSVMMAFYQKDIQFIKIPELDHEKFQYVGVKNVNDDENNHGVLIFSPAKIYKNSDNENRYLLTIAQFTLSGQDSTRINIGKFQPSETLIYIFKKNGNSQFELISESAESLTNDDFNYLPYPSEKIIQNIKNIGPKMKGYVEENEYSQEGYSSTKLNLMPFNDQKNILNIEVAEIGTDNEISNQDKKYNMQGVYKFLNSQHDGLYDIEIKYSGTKRVNTSDDFKIKPVNETHLYQYNAKQQKYVRVK